MTRPIIIARTLKGPLSRPRNKWSEVRLSSLVTIMQHYKNYPMMTPYRGNQFGVSKFPPILLVGESHYLPLGATQHLSPTSWYSGNAATLNEVETGWIDTAGVFCEGRSEKFYQKEHSIYRNSLWEMNQNGPKLSNYLDMADHVAFYNFFLRPGLQGDSLQVHEEDIKLANEAYKIHLEQLCPMGVVFLSRLAYWNLADDLKEFVPTVATPHPGTSWWNRKSAQYGGRKGREVLGDFIRTFSWPALQ